METLILLFLLLCLLALWQLYHLHLLHTLALRPALHHIRAHTTNFLYPLNDDDANETQAQYPHHCAEHASLVPSPLDGLGSPDYFTFHGHRARDLENLQVGSYAAGDERYWTAAQARAKREFVDAWTAAFPPGDPLDQDQLRYLFARLDVVFFSGALTTPTEQRRRRRLAPDQAPPPVRLVVEDWDPYALRRIRWNRRVAPVAYTDVAEAEGWVAGTYLDPPPTNNNANTQPPPPRPLPRLKSAGYQMRRNLTITLARQFDGEPLTRAEQLEALCHEAVRAFARLYWEWCPAEAVDVLGGDGHGGEVFHVMVTGILRTIAAWHEELRVLTPGGYYRRGADGGNTRQVLRHFSIGTAPPTRKRMFVLAAMAGLDVVQPWWEERVEARLRRAGRAGAAFWRENRWTGVLFVLWCGMVARAVFCALWPGDDGDGDGDGRAPETWVLSVVQALR
ncbi:hypothetical protein SLS62_009681 [Diatrype stigma]|uniref:Uncharacterized protein n=1 Tax=Diatrype stigma TaxID=117547 RepID=A0AAN9YKI2_9PEZI